MVVSPKEIHDGLVMQRVNEHYMESLTHFSDSRIVGIFLQGSQNYGLDYEKSDVDTKLIVVPTFEDIVFNKKPISTTHVLENDEHVDWKDIRLYMDCFYKQNVNFVEILFTPYNIINPMYKDEWNKLIVAREDIAHLNPYRAVKSMKGVALEKYNAMEHPYPSKFEILQKWGYDGKQVSHLIRIYDFLIKYIANETYENCLKPSIDLKDKIMAYKKQEIPLDIARVEAKKYLEDIIVIADNFCAKITNLPNLNTKFLLEDVTYSIMKINLQTELK